LSPRSIRAAFGDVVGTVFSYDNKLWRSLALLCCRPGALTRAYWEGKRTSYLDPLRMFLFFSVVVFFAPDTIGADGFQMPEFWLGPAAAGSGFLNRFKVGMERLATMSELDQEIQGAFYIEIAKHYLSLAMAAGALGMALFLRLVRRRTFLVEHFIFGLHLASFFYLANLAIRFIPAVASNPVVEAWVNSALVFGYHSWAFQALYAGPGFWRRLLFFGLSLLALLAFLIPYRFTGQICSIFTLMPSPA
jgi:hypothetical protein